MSSSFTLLFSMDLAFRYCHTQNCVLFPFLLGVDCRGHTEKLRPPSHRGVYLSLELSNDKSGLFTGKLVEFNNILSYFRSQ